MSDKGWAKLPANDADCDSSNSQATEGKKQPKDEALVDNILLFSNTAGSIRAPKIEEEELDLEDEEENVSGSEIDENSENEEEGYEFYEEEDDEAEFSD